MSHRRSPRFDSDLDQIWFYIATESGNPEIADQVTQAITKRLYLLSRNPYLGGGRADLRAGLRSFPVGRYVIIYRVENDEAIFLSVLPGDRNLEGLLVAE